MQLLEFQKQMFDEVLGDDCLVIASKGIGLHSLLFLLMKAFNNGDNLILIIGSSLEEQEYLIDCFKEDDDSRNSDRLPKKVNSDVSANERIKLYEKGGILFVTSRILVVDMLVKRIPFNRISGIIVCKAHSIVDSCQEAFILRLFRMNNKSGFIKAVSQNPVAFNQGFARLDRVMRLLFVRFVYLWPRFHAAITSSFDARMKPDVIEVRLVMSEEMKTIQFALMDLISMCLKEMAKCNVSLLTDVDGMTAENAISPGFDKMLRNQFDPVWHQLSAKTKRLINDLKLLRQLLSLLTSEDCVSFYLTLKAIKQNVRLDTSTSDWFFWEPTQVLFSSAKRRLFKVSDEEEKAELELNPKWISFCEMIEEIKQESLFLGNEVDVIVVVENDITTRRLKDVLDKGAKNLLNELYLKNIRTVTTTPRIDDAKRKVPKKKPIPKDENTVTLTQIVKNFDRKEELFKKKESFNIHYHVLNEGPLHLERLLKLYKPKYFILYDPNMQVVRQLEVYQALVCAPEKSKVYFFLYEGSAEEQKYLTSLRKEKLAFETLIKEKASMVVPSERDGKSEHHPDLIRGNPNEAATSSRQAGGQLSRNQVIQQRIIVDMREFRSVLPSIIHKRGIDIDPITIEIGDYVLTPETCVERKSVSDLIGSLNSGRLYSQTQVMTRHYKKSILLIEFDQNKSFNFKGKYWGLGRRLEAGEHDVVAKLLLLTLHFPQLRIVWSPSPYFSAEIFEHLKQNKEQPDSEKAITVIEEQLPVERSEDKYDIATKDFLLSIPGVNLYNVYAIMNRANSIAELCEKTEEDLVSIIGNKQNAETIYKFFHQDLVSCCVNDQLMINDEVKNKRFSKKVKK
ncbi:DNA repair endonuclease XPF-like protein [Dinothrombium tinctorium]|uniref:DNA repair endonuclease XPF n=1 Tax=Dinothrombium tinctorium TaxID=1965070 RepID=A0A3S3Q1L0_9ACAR|nr:DNA repair endonuclease XPF-like protein [Dinothrombium tinctorium]